MDGSKRPMIPVPVVEQFLPEAGRATQPLGKGRSLAALGNRTNATLVSITLILGMTA